MGCPHRGPVRLPTSRTAASPQSTICCRRITEAALGGDGPTRSAASVFGSRPIEISSTRKRVPKPERARAWPGDPAVARTVVSRCIERRVIRSRMIRSRAPRAFAASARIAPSSIAANAGSRRPAPQRGGSSFTHNLAPAPPRNATEPTTRTSSARDVAFTAREFFNRRKRPNLRGIWHYYHDKLGAKIIIAPHRRTRLSLFEASLFFA
jgi:hypothetical protein